MLAILHGAATGLYTSASEQCIAETNGASDIRDCKLCPRLNAGHRRETDDARYSNG